MHYVLTTLKGNEYKFYVLACAETYRTLWGGTIRGVEDQYITYPSKDIKPHLRLVA